MKATITIKGKGTFEVERTEPGWVYIDGRRVGVINPTEGGYWAGHCAGFTCGFPVDSEEKALAGMVARWLRRWVITKNVLDADDPEVTEDNPGVPKSIFEPDAKGGVPFQLFDDDGELYYRGRHFGDWMSERGFDPLDWAMGYAGCTCIKYRDPETGKWEVL
jgi:hypothetical protein